MSERKTAEEMAREAGQHNGCTVDVADVVALMERYAAQELAAAQALWARVAADTSRPVYAENVQWIEDALR